MSNFNMADYANKILADMANPGKKKLSKEVDQAIREDIVRDKLKKIMK